MARRVWQPPHAGSHESTWRSINFTPRKLLGKCGEAGNGSTRASASMWRHQNRPGAPVDARQTARDWQVNTRMRANGADRSGDIDRMNTPRGSQQVWPGTPRQATPWQLCRHPSAREKSQKSPDWLSPSQERHGGLRRRTRVPLPARLRKRGAARPRDSSARATGSPREPSSDRSALSTTPTILV